ncbi:MAG: hypothetical protein LBB83_09610 [Treponema sp.]|jgi:hypothetical protein|nr:hypothetical protein [Treponema sp.]
MTPAKFPFILLFLTVSATVFGAGEDVAGWESLAAMLRQEAVAIAERTVELETGGTGTSIWAYIPSTEEDAAAPDNGASAMPSLLENYTDIAGEISAGLASSADIPVELPADSLVLVIPLLGQRNENGLSWGAEMGLQFIRTVKDQYRRQNIIVVFPDHGGAGGEENISTLQDIYAAMDNPENSILLFLNFPVPPEELFIYHGSPRHIAPLRILKPLADTLEKGNIPYSFGSRFNELYKFSLIGRNPVTRFTQSRDMPSLFIGSARISPSGGRESRNPRNFLSPDHLGSLLAEYSEKAAVEIGNLDTHYSIYYSRGKTFFVSEIQSIALLLFVMGIVIIVFLFFFLFHRLKMLVLLKIGLSCSWVSVLYFFALFLSILAGEALLYVFAAIFRVSLFSIPLNRLYPLIGLSLLAGISLFLALPSPPLSLIRIKRRGGFYGFSAICFSIVLLLSGLILDITAAPLLTWMLICVALTMIRPHAVPAFIFSLAVTVRPVITFTEVLGNEELSRLFLLNFTLSTLTVTLFALPFLFSLMRAAMFAIPYRLHKKPVFLFVKLGLFVLSAVIMAAYLGSV